MDELKELKGLVHELEKSTSPVEKLQEIGRELLTEYIILLPDGVEIQPLWIEAYYSNLNEDKKFDDPFIHGVDEQKGEENFGKLYFHHKTDDQRSGVDICLPCGPYSLSFLLKYTLVNGEYTTQSQLSGKIRAAYNKLNEKDKSQILRTKQNRTEYIVYTSRIGLDSKKEKDPIKREAKEIYQPLPLAIVRDFYKAFPTNLSLPRKEKLIKQYLDSSDKTAAEKSAFCQEYLGYCPSKYKEK